MWIPLSTFVMGLGFALGPPAQRCLDSLLFVLVISPFEVGDRVAIDKVNNNGTMTVVQVHILTSEFSDVQGKRIIARNCDLTAMSITNLRRSPNATFMSKFILEQAGATPELLRRLHERVLAHVRSKPLDWKPSASMTTAFIEPNKLEVGWSITHHASWGEGGKVWPAHSEFVVAVTAAMRDLQLRYTLPPQQVSLVGAGSKGSQADALTLAAALGGVHATGISLAHSHRPSGWTSGGYGQGGLSDAISISAATRRYNGSEMSHHNHGNTITSGRSRPVSKRLSRRTQQNARQEQPDLPANGMHMSRASNDRQYQSNFASSGAEIEEAGARRRTSRRQQHLLRRSPADRETLSSLTSPNSRQLSSLTADTERYATSGRDASTDASVRGASSTRR